MRLFLTSSIALLACAGFAYPATITVPTDQPTIQDAVDNAVTGDVIVLNANTATTNGEYFENVVVPNTITSLTFRGDVVWDGNIAGAEGVCLTITGPGDGFLIEKITFRNSSGGVHAGPTGAGFEVHNVTVRRCRGVGTNNDFVRIFGNNASVIRCNLLGTRNDCIEIHGDDAEVFRNKIGNADGDVVFVEGDRALVKKNVVNILEDGDIIDIRGNDAQILSNRAMSADGNIRVDGQNALIRGNKLENISGEIRVLNGDGAKILKNDLYLMDNDGIDATGDGIQVIKNKLQYCFEEAIRTDGPNATIRKNKIHSCHGGILSNNASGSNISNNRVEYLFDNVGISVRGDLVTIDNNTIANLTDDGDGIRLSAPGTGGGFIRNNRISHVTDHGIQCSSPGVTISRNSVRFAGAEEEDGYNISGDNCVLNKNTARNCDGDGFHVSGAGNTLTDCVAINCYEDGFDAEGDNNTFIDCRARGCAGEGFDNSTSLGTTLTGGSLKNNRIDLAGNTGGGATITVTGTTFVTGGIATAPEVD